MLGEQSAAFGAELGLVLKPVNDRGLDFVPLDPLLSFAPMFGSPMLAAVSGQPSVHHDHQHVVTPGLTDTSAAERGFARGFAQGDHAGANGVVADRAAPSG